MSVNVALCGSIPRAHLTKGTGAPCSLAPSLNRDSQTDDNRCGTSKLTLGSVRPSIQIPQNNENMRPFGQPLGQVFDAPSWAVPAPGEARLEVCNQSELDMLIMVVRSPSQLPFSEPYSLFVKRMDAIRPLT